MLGSGISSESIWTPFDSLTTASVRPLKARVYVAWTRLVSADAYATVGTSVIGGTDIIKGIGDTAINEADSYFYFDETDKVLRIEYERSLIEPLGGTSIAMADVLLDNTDLRFTPNIDSTIGTALRPNRPIKIFIGFEVRGQETLIPIIEGVTLQPKENKNSRTVSIQVFDFMKSLNEIPQETAIYTDQRSDQIIADILSRAGVGTSSYQLDQGLNTVEFAWFEKGQTAGERIKQLCEAEEAIFYQDESGILRFETRDKYSQSPFNAVVWDINPEDIIKWEQDYSSRIINRAIVKGSPRSVKDETEVWRDGAVELIPAGTTVTIWAEFEDPVSSFTSPVSTTDYKAYANEDGTGTDLTSDISITTTDFTKTVKMEIENTGGTDAYVTFLRIRGTPATIDYTIKEVFEDSGSVADYNEQQIEIDNPYIDQKTFASNMAQNIVRRYKSPIDTLRLTVKGIPQLQLRDQVRVYDPDQDAYTNYRVLKIQGVYEPGSFLQTLKLRKITSNESL